MALGCRQTGMLISHCLAILVLASSIAAGDAGTTESDSTAASIPWHGGHPPKHHAFLISELALLHRFGSSNSNPEREHFYLTGEVGALINTGTHHAFGGTLYWGGHDDGSLFGIKGRYRRWWKGIGLDVSPGILIAGHDNYYHLDWPPGFTGHVGMSIGDWIVLTGQVDAVRHSSASILDIVPWSGDRYIEVPEGTEVNFYLGAKLGSYLAPVAGLAILVILGATFSGGIM